MVLLRSHWAEDGMLFIGCLLREEETEREGGGETETEGQRKRKREEGGGGGEGERGEREKEKRIWPSELPIFLLLICWLFLIHNPLLATSFPHQLQAFLNDLPDVA